MTSFSSPANSAETAPPFDTVSAPFGNSVCQSGEHIGVRQSRLSHIQLLTDEHGESASSFVVNRWVEERRMTMPTLLVGVQKLCRYVASLGPREVEDRAGGYPHPLEEGVVCIPLPTGAIADIDADDYPLVRAHSWQHANDGRVHSTHIYGGQRFCLRLHRVVMMLGSGDGRVVDHRDHNPLNNRKTNLRVCTQHQNSCNRRRSSTNTSGIKGVNQYGTRWRATVSFKGKDHVRSFDTPEEAETWVRAKRIELHGEFACHE